MSRYFASDLRSFRLDLLLRIAAALFGGYALAYYAAAALALLLPLTRSEAVAVAQLSGLLIYTAAIMWVFAARSAARAWLGLVLVTLPCALIAYLHGTPA